MSFKNVAAGIDFGGCKTTVQMAPLDLADLAAVGFLAYALDRCRTMTGPDMNFPTGLSDVVNARFSTSFTSGPGSPLGETGRPTAYGTFLALREAVRFREGRASLTGKSVAVMGLGAVGWHMAEHLLDAGASLYVADIDEDRVGRFLAAHAGGRNGGSGAAHGTVQAIPAARVLDLEADVLCPCAVGGILSEEVIARLRFPYVFGPANNQLAATDQREEIRLARLLAERGILFQTEWWHNNAGVMCGAEEYLHGARQATTGYARGLSTPCRLGHDTTSRRPSAWASPLRRTRTASALTGSTRRPPWSEHRARTAFPPGRKGDPRAWPARDPARRPAVRPAPGRSGPSRRASGSGAGAVRTVGARVGSRSSRHSWAGECAATRRGGTRGAGASVSG